MNSFSGTVAVIGCGKMGEILASGLVRSGLVGAQQVLVTDASATRLQQVIDRYGFQAAPSNLAASEGANFILLAVKPKDLGGVLDEIAPGVGESHLVISVAAGVSTTFIQDRLVPGAAVVRAMPNVASQVGEGMTAICAGSNAVEEDLGIARRLLETVGVVIRVDESYIDAVTAVSGSGPAYFALFAEAMIDAAVTVGLPRDLAARLVGQTMRGTSALVSEAGMQPVEIREAVTSPGGTTAMGVRELERAAVRSAVLNAVQAALDRSQALG